MEATAGNVNSSLLKSWSPVIGLGHNEGGGVKFYVRIYRGNVEKSSSQNPFGEESCNLCGGILRYNVI